MENERNFEPHPSQSDLDQIGSQRALDQQRRGGILDVHAQGVRPIPMAKTFTSGSGFKYFPDTVMFGEETLDVESTAISQMGLGQYQS